MDKIELFQLFVQETPDRWKPFKPTVSWEVRESLNEQTKFLDYGCRFENGKCITNLERYQTAECCCTNCVPCRGHLSSIPPYAVEQIASLFSEETGFWRKEKGCILPRKWRSFICLNYQCKMPEHEYKKLRKLLD